MYLCIWEGLSLSHHKKDDVILPNSGVAAVNKCFKAISLSISKIRCNLVFAQ